MSFLLTLGERKKKVFERLDSLSIGRKSLFGWYVPIWQYVLYGGVIFYFIATLLFQEYPYPYTAGLVKPFFVLLNEMVHPTGTHINPILNRGLDNGGHVLAYLSLIGCALAIRIKLPKTSEGFYFSILLTGMAVSASEGLFNVFYWILNYNLWPHPSWFVFILTNPLAIIYIFSILIGLFVTPVWKFLSLKRFYLCVFVIIAYFIAWATIGFPVTLSSIDYLRGFGLETVYYNNLFVNTIEIGQWLTASVIFSLAVE